MKILFVCSEVAPFAKTGGMADVAGALPLAIRRKGHDVSVFLPYYQIVTKGGYAPKMILPKVSIPVAGNIESSSVHLLESDGVKFYFLEQNRYYNREFLYGPPAGDYPDNAERFIYFNRAVLEAVKQLAFRPDIIHCNDWQTALIPVYLKSLYKNDPFFHCAASLLTIHNVAYQGDFWHWDLHLTGLGWEYFVPKWIEFYGRINLLKSGILHADLVNTVSERYAQEIQTSDYSHGLERVLQARKDSLSGIVNGIDYNLFNPAHDKFIPQKYDTDSVEKKITNKTALQNQFKLANIPDKPVIGMVSRLAQQKGIDLVVSAAEDLLKLGVQLVILGTGDENYHNKLFKLAKAHPHQIGLNLSHDEKMASLIYAGSDFFLMPSRYEPCGLGQMIAMRYGTIPIVRYTGGLADTVTEFDPTAKRGTGFGFEDYKAAELVKTVKRALAVYGQLQLWHALLRNAMNADFSWNNSAAKYEKLYQQAHHISKGWHSK
ncbi:MAG: glycogen synthase GlgA [Candidatus Schekmanbacteria bacterium]|nr:glycogen synthase GlgA [Candidatus Schekmanbacteria bacterium]